MNTFSPIQDGVANLISKIGSDVDPTIHQITANCPQDLLNWFASGGLAKKITSFWAHQMGTGLELSVIPPRESGRSKKSAEILTNWLQGEFDRVDVLQLFIEAELQCAVSSAAPMVIITDGIDLLSESPTKYNRVEMLQIQDPAFFQPEGGMLLSRGGMDLRTVSRYTALRGGGTAISADRVLPLQAQKLLAVEQYRSHLERYWGRPRVGTNIILAAIAYDVICKYAEILVQKKNFLSYGIRGFNEGMKGGNSEQYAADCLKTLKLLQKTAGLLGIEIHDIDDSLVAIDRNVTGVKDLIIEVKHKLLAECPGIPETYLFGRQSNGGLANDNNQSEQVNAEAQRLFHQRWHPMLKKLVTIMLNGDSCPVKGWGIDMIKIDRTSGFSPDPLEAARTNLINAQAEKINPQTIL